MKSQRVALVTGFLALGVAACGDDVQIVEPTPPPPPPLTATMAPASATVAVGNSVVFAVNASGGAAGAQASWTCASSNTGIATASNDGGGLPGDGHQKRVQRDDYRGRVQGQRDGERGCRAHRDVSDAAGSVPTRSSRSTRS